jgi:hypothetical protein
MSDLTIKREETVSGVNSGEKQKKQENTIQVSFKHIYNGLIMTKNGFFPMIEFKIEQKNLSDEKSTSSTSSTNPTKTKVLFKDVDFKCAWFIIASTETDNKLIGPVKIDTERIKEGKRIIKDPMFEHINGLEIEGVSNKKEFLIKDDDIPRWMLDHLEASVFSTEL